MAPVVVVLEEGKGNATVGFVLIVRPRVGKVSSLACAREVEMLIICDLPMRHHMKSLQI